MAKSRQKASRRQLQVIQWISRLSEGRLKALQSLKPIVDDCERIDPPDITRTAKVWVVGRNPNKRRR